MFRRGHQECVPSVLVPKDSERGAVWAGAAGKDKGGTSQRTATLSKPLVSQGLVSPRGCSAWSFSKTPYSTEMSTPRSGVLPRLVGHEPSS